MISPDAVANEILRKVVAFVKKGDQLQLRALDSFPVAIYVTDTDGFITYFNPACIDFAGRTPTLNQDRWCVTWKLYTDRGDFLPHERCPMAVAIQTKRAVRGITAVAERPDGIRIKFQPFPTPVIDENGELLGAVNLLVDVTDHRGAAAGHDPQTSPSERVEQALQTFTIAEVQYLVDEIENALAPRPPRLLN
jgi:PAS domain S-box-containing protein